MELIVEITRAAVAHSRDSGHAATWVYLGREPMKRLMRWARETGYVESEELREGAHRPEVNGLRVYEVNDDEHLCVA